MSVYGDFEYTMKIYRVMRVLMFPEEHVSFLIEELVIAGWYLRLVIEGELDSCFNLAQYSTQHLSLHYPTR